jgi:hypothetical protein
VITARASWNPRMDLDIEDALSFFVSDITKIFGPAQNEAAQILLNYIQLQRNLLIYGEIDGEEPNSKISYSITRNALRYH